MKIEVSNWYRVLTPRAVVLISTVNKKGISNAAPFSFVMPVSVEPPMIAFASDPEHDTISNIKETRDFAVNIPNVDMLNQLWTRLQSQCVWTSLSTRLGTLSLFLAQHIDGTRNGIRVDVTTNIEGRARFRGDGVSRSS